MTRDDARRLLSQHQDALNRHDVAALAQLYADDAVLVSPMFDTVRGRAAIRRSYERLFEVFPDYSLEVSDALSLFDGHRAAEFSTVTGTHRVELYGLPPTGQQIEYHAARLFTFDEGLITYEQRIYDFGGLLERLEKVRLDREMTLAFAVQVALCRARHDGSFVEAVGASLPCRAIGGDFLRYLDLPDARFAMAVGDVAGKGPAAALVAAMLQGMFSSIAEDSADPSQTLTRLNAALRRRAIEPRFATLTFVTITPGGTLTYSNAGHNPPLLLTARGIVTLAEGGPLLGAFDDAQFPQASMTLAAGDTIIAFSDGVIDAVDPDGSDFGTERLMAVAAAHHGATPQALLRLLLDTVQTFAGGAPPNDDVTVAVARYR